jgi:tRNA A-37 threonylcarbamoyl transferase component Bud32
MSSFACPTCGNLNRVGAKFCGRCGAALTAPQPSGGYETGRLGANSLINDRYVIVRVIGRGGMGAVYLVTDTLDQNRVMALKEMSNAAIVDARDRAMAVAQFQREAQLLRRLRHPNLPAVSDEFAIGDRNYLVMEYVPGSTLQQMLDRGEGPFPESRVVTWANQLCDVLDYLHRQQPAIIFRDLKPANVMIMADDRLKLIDFGIARVFKPGQHQDTMLLGTQGYAAPEQYGGGQSDARSDIYALGATLFSLLTAQDPAQMTPLKPLPSVRDYRPDVSPYLESIVLRATRISARERWQSTQELRQAIATIALTPGEPTPHPAPVPPQPLPAPTRPSPAPGPTHRVTTRLLLRAAGLSNRQVALAGGGLLLAVVALVAGLAPVVYGLPALWNYGRFEAIAGPFVFAATRRRFLGGAAHFVVVIAGQWLALTMNDLIVENWLTLLLGAALSAAVIELMIALLPRVLGGRRREDAGAWQREAGWFGLAAVLALIAAQWLINGISAALNPGYWLVAFILGVAGWFLGDLVQGYLYLKQTGVHWR